MHRVRVARACATCVHFMIVLRAMMTGVADDGGFAFFRRVFGENQSHRCSRRPRNGSCLGRAALSEATDTSARPRRARSRSTRRATSKSASRVFDTSALVSRTHRVPDDASPRAASRGDERAAPPLGVSSPRAPRGRPRRGVSRLRPRRPRLGGPRGRPRPRPLPEARVVPSARLSRGRARRGPPGVDPAARVARLPQRRRVRRAPGRRPPRALSRALRGRLEPRRGGARVRRARRRVSERRANDDAQPVPVRAAPVRVRRET